MRRKKRYIFKKVIPMSVLLILTFVGIVYINIINTKTLSPLGNTKQNYELVSERFGKDFENFIKDNSYVKIYNDEDNKEIIVRLGDNEFKISSESEILQYIKDKINSI
ncbi:MAG: hypothetical protein ACI398_10355 [Clostridium sp.]